MNVPCTRYCDFSNEEKKEVNVVEEKFARLVPAGFTPVYSHYSCFLVLNTVSVL